MLVEGFFFSFWKTYFNLVKILAKISATFSSIYRLVHTRVILQNRINTTRTVARKLSIGGLTFVRGGLTFKFDKNSTDL